MLSRAVVRVAVRGAMAGGSVARATAAGGVRSLTAAAAAAEKPKKELVSVTFVAPNGEKETVKGREGDSLLDVAHDNDIEVEGACGGEMACSTCHCILDEAVFKKLPKPKPEEEDMLDLALGLTPTSRLGCQVKLAKWMEGMVVRLPKEVNNMQSKA